MKKINQTNYWNLYYKKKNNIKMHSNFARFVNKKFLKKSYFLLDVGTGNGRDAFYFSRFVKQVHAIDRSNTAIEINKENNKNKINNLFFYKISFEKLNTFKFNNKINFIYARFFIHSINNEKENLFLENFSKFYKKNTIMALAFRTTKDDLMKKGIKLSKNERYTSHYRRFVDIKIFEEKIKKFKFKILYKKTGKNFSKIGNSDPNLCRVVFKKIL
jgi:tellurite methyltransferase